MGQEVNNASLTAEDILRVTACGEALDQDLLRPVDAEEQAAARAAVVAEALGRMLERGAPRPRSAPDIERID